MNRSILARLGLAAAIAAVAAAVPSAYVLKPARWNSLLVPFYVNPANSDVTPQAAVAALQSAALGWTLQSLSPFRFDYAGTTSGSSVTYNGKNEVFFRNATSGGAIATTYSWSSGSTLLDADIVFWDAAFTFYTGTSGCSGGLYIEDVATHEFGHALGLAHSGVQDATMYATTSYCGMSPRSLALDDILGVEALYPPAGANSEPFVSISSPAEGSTFAEGASIVLSGSAQDAEDGALTAAIVWSSSLTGYLGRGGSLTVQLPAGTHTIKALVTDSAGATRSDTVSVAIQASAPQPAPAPASEGPTLTVRAYKVKGVQHAELKWAGLSSTSVTIIRGGAVVGTTANDGLHIDAIGAKGGGTVVYQVCEVGSSVCSNKATASF